MSRAKPKKKMNPRERMLAILLGVFVAGYLLWPMVRGYLITPIESRYDELAKLDEDIVGKKKLELLTLADAAQIGIWQSRSLPPDPLDAQRAYLGWMVDLATHAGLETPVVTTTQPVGHGGVYSTISVDIVAEAEFDTLVRFLFLAQRTDLMHRVARIELDSTGRSTNDPLEVHIVTEGCALSDAEPRSVLFPRTQLADAAGKNVDQFVPSTTEGFPVEPGFEIQIGGEFARVIEIDGGRWTLERGLHESLPRDHAAGATVELVPVSEAWTDRSLESYAALLQRNPFAEPRRYTPSVSPVSDIRISRGDTARTRLRVSGYDTSLGEPRFEFAGDAEPGMTFDAESGEFAWTPNDDVPATSYEIVLRATVPGLAEPVDKSFDIVLVEPNAAPRLADAGSHSVVQGGELRFVATATDPDEGQMLRYELRNAPDGATIDARSGTVTWRVPIDFSPGESRLSIRVEDDRGASDSIDVPVTIRENSARSTFLVGAINRDGEREAWLLDRKTGEKRVLREGVAAQIAGVESFVLVIGQDFVLIEQDEVTYRLDLGQSLENLEEQVDEPAN